MRADGFTDSTPVDPDRWLDPTPRDAEAAWLDRKQGTASICGDSQHRHIGRCRVDNDPPGEHPAAGPDRLQARRNIRRLADAYREAPVYSAAQRLGDLLDYVDLMLKTNGGA